MRSCVFKCGTNGSGGPAAASATRSSGAGFSGDGSLVTTWGAFTYAYSFLNGGIGARSTNQTPNRNGGFGGGGAAHGNCCIGAGAGGGYSGGGPTGNCGPGAGGGSYVASSAQSGTVKTSVGSYNGLSSGVTNLALYNTAGGPTDFFGAAGYVIITRN